MPKTEKLIQFEYRELEIGFFVKFQIPYSPRNWNWVVNHPNTAMIRKVYKPIR